MSLEETIEAFTKEANEVGGLAYKKNMILDFVSYWTEPNRAAKPRCRFQLEKTWLTKRRMATWAKNSIARGQNPFISDSEKTIEQKRRDFIAQLRPYKDKYGSAMLNSFYAFYGQPNNSATPEFLRWEKMDFWSLETRLEQWSSREKEASKNKVF